MNNKIVVIMSVYKNDQLEYLKDAMESLYNQTYKNFDIYIQCDGVLPTILEEYLDKEYEKDKIALLNKREINKGLAYSLNELLQKVLECDYEYIVRMDADDISLPERIKKQFTFMEKNKDIDICGTYIEEFGDGVEYSKIVTYPLDHDGMFRFFMKRVPVAHVSVMFRNSFFQKAGLYPVEDHITNEDTLMWMKGFVNSCRFANLSIVGTKVRISQGFFNRRSGFDKVVSDFKNRLQVIKTLNYGFISYLYATAVFIINILPANLKKIAYKYLRG